MSLIRLGASVQMVQVVRRGIDLFPFTSPTYIVRPSFEYNVLNRTFRMKGVHRIIVWISL